MDPDRTSPTPTNRGAGGFKTIAVIFACVLAVLVLAGVWATSEIGENSGPPPTTSNPK